MAMTKKEKAEIDALIQRAELLAALRWSTAVLPDVAPPEIGLNVRYSNGWLFNAYSLSVEQAWSASTSHGYGVIDPQSRYTSGSQNPSWLFSTQERALLAMRHAVEHDSAAKLLKIDKMIEAVGKAA